MKVKIVENKYLNALFLLMLFSAIVHMVILFFVALTTQSIYVLNYFDIVNISYFAPSFFNSSWVTLFSFIFTLFLYLLILNINERN